MCLKLILKRRFLISDYLCELFEGSRVFEDAFSISAVYAFYFCTENCLNKFKQIFALEHVRKARSDDLFVKFR